MAGKGAVFCALRKQFAFEHDDFRNRESLRRERQAAMKIGKLTDAVRSAQPRDRQMRMESPVFARESSPGAVIFEMLMQPRQV